MAVDPQVPEVAHELHVARGGRLEPRRGPALRVHVMRAAAGLHEGPGDLQQPQAAGPQQRGVPVVVRGAGVGAVLQERPDAAQVVPGDRVHQGRVAGGLRRGTTGSGGVGRGRGGKDCG